MSLSGKIVYITGGSSGIGAQLARELVGRGSSVGLLARRGDRLEELADELREAGGTAAWRIADVTGRDGLHAACDALSEELGEADIVVANAGYNRPETMRDFKPGRALSVYNTNLLGCLHLFDWALPRFLARGSGHIVGISSVASYFGFPGNAAYCGSKAALRVHLQSLRLSLKRRRIPVTTICPGFVASELTDTVDFEMPFLWPTDRAARRIADAIEARRAEVVFPWQMRLAVPFGVARLLPRAVVEWLLVRPK